MTHFVLYCPMAITAEGGAGGCRKHSTLISVSACLEITHVHVLKWLHRHALPGSACFWHNWHNDVLPGCGMFGPNFTHSSAW